MPRALIERTREHLLSCHIDLALAAIQFRLRRLALASELRYDSNQPRHPAGTAEGGRWSGGAGSEGPSDPPSGFPPGDGVSERDRRRAEILATSTVLTDDEGNEVSNIAGQTVLYPNEMPPSFFIDKGEANRAGMIAVAVTSMAVLFALPFIALGLMSSDNDEIRSRSLSPDGGREVQIVIRDRAVGLIGGARFFVLRMRQTGDWSLRGWQDFAYVTAADPDRLRFATEWTNERRLAIVIEGEAKVSPHPPTVMGIAVIVR